MSKINIPPVSGGFNLSQINSNFDQIEQHLNDRVLYRDVPTGEPNQMVNDLDMNSYRIYNLPEPSLDHEPARFKEIKEIGPLAQGYAEAAKAEADRAKYEADRAFQSAVYGGADNLKVFNDYASASVAAATLPDDQVVEAPDANGRLSIFEVQSGALVFKDFAPNAIRLQSYTELRTYTGASQTVDVSDPGVAGRFNRDDADTVTTDNGGTVIVDGSGRRWKRVFSGGVDLLWFGAVEGQNCASAIVAASAATVGVIIVPPGGFVATATTLNSATLLSVLNRIRCYGTLTITCAAGTHNFTSQAIVNSPDAQRIQILGATTISTTANSQISVSGSAKNYSVTIGVASSAGAAVGDYALIRTDVTGTGDFYAHAGVWKITAVDSGGSNRLTLLNTHHGAAFPTNTLTGGTVVVLKTILKFTGCDGFRFEGGQPLGLLDRVAIVGDYDVAAATGTTGAHGIVMSAPVIVGGASSNAAHNMTGNAVIGASVGVSAFGEQGIAVSGRCTLLANFVASCSNRKRGWYAEGGHIRSKFVIGSGNGEDGFISDVSGAIQANNSIASGNGLDGFWSTNNSFLACATSYATGNLSHGFEARGLTRLSGDGSVSLNNGGSGFSASDGGMIDADNATASANGNSGFYASSGSVIDADNSTSTSNTGYGYRGEYKSVVRAAGSTVSGNTTASYYSRNSVVFESSGAVAVNDIGDYSVAPRFYNTAKTNYFSPVLTAIGDLVWTNGTNRFVMKADGTFHPSADNAQALGRASERWSVVYAGTGTINTSDERDKQQVRDLSAAERAVATRLKSLVRAFKFNDAVEAKGEGARIHFGVMAQDVKEAFEAEGLNAFEYALLCYDEWSDEYTEILDDTGQPTGEQILTTRAGNRYGIRYEELLAFIVSAL
jgi:hypothetical protein